MRDIASLTRKLTKPAIHVVKIGAPARSHFGGEPELPAGKKWPEWNGRRLAFVARISLDEVHRAHRFEWLPTSGALLFFYDVDSQPWGFHPKHRGSAAVIHVPDLETPAPRTRNAGAVGFSNVGFKKIDLLPGDQDEAVEALDLREGEYDAYATLRYLAFGRQPWHQIGGYPTPIQNNTMELNCQLASSGIDYHDDAASESPRARMLATGAKDWRLLFQVDSDRGIGVMWGDCRTIYFWVRESDAAKGRFEDIWVILQCS